MKKCYGFLSYLFLVLAAILSAVDVQAQAGCCCDPVTRNGSISTAVDCPANFIFIPSPRTRICSVECQAAVAVPPPPTPIVACADPRARAPQDLRLTPVKGALAFKLEFVLPCPSDLIKIERCKGTGCADFKQIDLIAPTTVYVDESGLEFNANYTYRISTRLNVLGDSEPLIKSASSGDVECLFQVTNDQFCLSKLAYELYRGYLTTFGYLGKTAKDFTTAFDATIVSIFNARFNKGFACDDKNTLLGPAIICREGQVCVSSGTASCITPGKCESAANTFGLFGSAKNCEGENNAPTFCFLDRSKTAVDKCFACNTRMACYDYKSRGACERDACGIGQCRWQDIIAPLGIGVCVDTRFNNCAFCSQRGTPDATNKEGFNEVFDICNAERTKALSTDLFPCFFVPARLNESAKAVSCEGVTCSDYTKGQCQPPTEGVRLDGDNRLASFSTDPCGIRVCDFTPERGCAKNADGSPTTQPFWEDCESGNRACESDFIPPVTAVVPLGFGNRTDFLRIKVTDRASRAAALKDVLGIANYTTLVCVHTSNTTPCQPNTPVTKDRLNINDITLQLQQDTTPIAKVIVGSNIIRFYSIDNFKNKEIVQQREFKACANCSGPQLLNLTVSNSRQIGDTIFTFDKRPKITAVFNKLSNITIATLTRNRTQTALVQTPAIASTSYTLTPSSDMEEGEYFFALNAQDQNRFFMDAPVSVRLKLDFTSPNLTITPPDGTVLNDTATPIILRFSEPVSLENVSVEEHVYFNQFVDVLVPREITRFFATEDNVTYRVEVSALDAGVKTIHVLARDFTGRPVEVRSNFFINTKPVKIRMAKPTFGVASTVPFDIVIETTTGNGVPTSFVTPPNTPKVNLPALPPITTLETAPPSITAVPTTANTTANKTPTGAFVAITGMQVVQPAQSAAGKQVDCRYLFDTPTSPAKETHQFLPFFNISKGNQHIISGFTRIPLTSNRSHPFHVLCKDSFGITNATFRLSIDTTPPVIVEAFADPVIVGEELTPLSRTFQTTLKVQISEEGFCRYSTISEVFAGMENMFPGFDQLPKKAHLTDFLVTTQGRHKVFVACKNLAGLASTTRAIEFTVDTTIPFQANSTTPATSRSKNFTLSMSTNKRAFCYFGTAREAMTTCMGGCNFTRTHAHGVQVNASGTFTFFAQCNTAASGETSPVFAIPVVVDTTPPVMVYAKDDGQLPNLTNVQYKKDRLRVAFLGNDTETAVTQYIIRIDGPGGAVVDWMPSTKLDGEFHFIAKNHLGEPLNLVDKQQYVLRAKAVNIVGLNSTEMASDGVLIDFSKEPPTCENRELDGEESDIDCGGPECSPCKDNQRCATGNDCESKVCSAGTCQTASCEDSTTNQDETDIDCGGACETKCELGRACKANTDCTTGACTSGQCQKPEPCKNTRLDEGETDIDCGGVCADKCGQGKSCREKTDCATGMHCIENTCTSELGGDEDQDGVPDRVDRCPDTKGDESVDENGCSTCQIFKLGDSIPDCWRQKYFGCIDCPQADKDADPDNDGLTNEQEFRQGTNPTMFDTDGDRYGDGLELEKQTDPLDPRSHPTSIWAIMLWFLLAIIIAGALGFGGYVVYQGLQARKPPVEVKLPEVIERIPPPKPKKPEIDKLAALRKFAKRPAEKPYEEPGWITLKELGKLAGALKKEEVRPAIFEKLKALKEGRLPRREKAALIKELMKEPAALEKLRLLRARMALPAEAEEHVAPLEKLRRLGIRAPKREEIKKPEKLPEKLKPQIERLRKLFMEGLTPEEQQEVIKRFKLLKAGRLTDREKEELFAKLRITAQYYKTHKKEIEKELAQWLKRKY